MENKNTNPTAPAVGTTPAAATFQEARQRRAAKLEKAAEFLKKEFPHHPVEHISDEGTTVITGKEWHSNQLHVIDLYCEANNLYFHVIPIQPRRVRVVICSYNG